MTIDDIFTQVKARFTDGRGRAYANNACLYRTPQGVPCAVGALIADDEYDPAMECKPVDEIQDLLPERLLPHIEALKGLQAIHDSDWNWSKGKITLRGSEDFNNAAKRHGSTVRIHADEC